MCSSTATPRPIAPAPAPCRCSAGRCAFACGTAFPLLTTKKLHTRSIIHELLWFLQGDTNIRYLKENGVSIWDEWADADGELGPVYGKQWRRWETADGRTVDQIARVIERHPARSPDSRRHLVLGVESGRGEQHGPAALPRAVPVLRRRRAAVVPALPAQRGHLPRRAVQHRLLRPARPTWSRRCANSSRAISSGPAATATCTATTWSRRAQQFEREPRPLPTLRLNPAVRDLFGFRFEDIALEGYDPHPHIKAPVAV